MSDIPNTPVPPAPAGVAGKTSVARFPQRRTPAWREQPVIWFILLVLFAVVLAGGGTPVWARALVLVGVGIWVMLQPPKEAPTRLFEVSLFTFIVIAVASAFIPAAWLGHMYWRADALQLGVVLPATNATSPWLAAEAMAQLIVGVVWLYACCNLKLNHESRRHALWGIVGATAVLASGAAIINFLNLTNPKHLIKYPLGTEAVNFSYFPNRNQTALWFALGGVVALGMLLEGLRKRRQRYMLAGLMLVPCVLALVMGRSRMAMALFALGSVLVVVIRLGRDAGNYAVRILLPLAIILVSMLVFFGDESMWRVTLFGNTAEAPEFRIELWRDTLNLVKTQPMGVGLGQFSQVYPQYRDHARAFQSVRHPDSDWFWLLGETGWVGVLAAAVAVGALMAILLGKEGRASGPYRHIASMCVALFFLHSLVDVPGHRFGTWMLAGWFIALALPERTPVRSLVPRWLWRGTGVALLVVGLLWMGAEFGLPTNAILVEERDMNLADAAITQGDGNATLVAATAAAQIEPMQWRPYFQRARAALTLLNNAPAALADFRRARYVEPTWAGVPYAEGLLWMSTNPDRAFAAWREAAQRESDNPEGLWRDIWDHLHKLPHGEEYVSAISKIRPLYRNEYLTIQVSPERFAAEWADEITRDPLLKNFSQEQRKELLQRWATLDGNATLNYLSAHPNIVPQMWLIEAEALAAAGRVAEALQVVRNYLPPLDLPKASFADSMNEERLKADFHTNPNNIDFGVDLLHEQIDAKEFDGALETLNVLAKQPKPAPFVAWWRADLLARAGRTEDAWKAIQPYIEYQKKYEDKSVAAKH